MSLDDGNFVKVICAAGTEDEKIVHNICLVYTLAGADCIDMACNPKVVAAGRSGVVQALELSKKNGKTAKAPILCVSFGVEGDQHVRKARVTEKGKHLIALTKVCPTNAIVGGTNGEPVRIIEEKCIGAGKCDTITPGAVEFYTIQRDFSKILPECVQEGASMIELHANAGTDEEVVEKWSLMNSTIPNGYLSLCIGRSYKSNKEIVGRVEKIRAISGNRTIIQADGTPMTGTSESPNTTLQAVAMGDVIRKIKNPPYVILSGGTNIHTPELAKFSGVLVNGISFGSYARKIINEYLELDGLEENPEKLAAAVEKASAFVSSIKSGLRRV